MYMHKEYSIHAHKVDSELESKLNTKRVRKINIQAFKAKLGLTTRTTLNIKNYSKTILIYLYKESNLQREHLQLLELIRKIISLSQQAQILRQAYQNGYSLQQAQPKEG